MNLKDFKTTKERRTFLEKELKIKLENVAKAHVDDEKTIHCENLIGSTILPLGVAGPISIKNEELRVKNYYVPLATTEGALVASVSRGFKAINLSGGATSFVENVGVTRGPVFETSGLGECFKLKIILNAKLLSDLSILLSRKLSQPISDNNKKEKVKVYQFNTLVSFFSGIGSAGMVTELVFVLLLPR